MESRNNKTQIILILGALTTISPFSIDMYLPAFARMAASLSTDTSTVALSLSSYFIGLAVGQIFYGPFLDRFGRKRPLYFGLALYLISSIACALSGSIHQLILARLFQALGGCAASVGSTAMVRDFFDPADGAKVFSRLMLILSVSPLFAPTVGGWIVSNWGWQAIFITLSLIVVLVFAVVVVALPEGHAPDSTVSLHPGEILRVFGEILRDRQFFTYTVSGAFSFAGLFTYLSGAPGIFMGKYLLSEKMFGLIFAFLSIGMVAGGQINIWLTRLFSTQRIFTNALRMQVASGLIFFVGAYFEWWNLYWHIGLFCLYISSIGLIYPNATAMALEPFSDRAGSASALLGTIQMGVGALASAAFGLLPMGPSLAVAVMFVLTSVAALLIKRCGVP